MSLATRCTACGTIFRVVEDQLRVSEGWVRCGRCAEVFDAREQLFDIDLEAPPPWPPVSTSAQQADAPALDLAVQEHGQTQRGAPARNPELQRPVQQTQAEAPARQNAPAPASRASEERDFSGHDSIVAAAMDSRHEPRWIDDPQPETSSASAAQDTAPRWTEPEIEQEIEQEVQDEMARLAAEHAASQVEARQRAEMAQEIEVAMLAESERQARLAAANASNNKAPEPADDDGDHGFQATTLGAGGELLAEAEASAQIAQAALVAQTGQPASSGEAVRAGANSGVELPEFLRPARSHALWSRLWVRLSLGLLCGLALAGLGLQATWQFRDALLARYPQLRPELQAFCQLAQCELKPWQRLESFSVDSSALSQAGSGHHYKLALSLRNKSEFELALPWVELSLTDANGQLIARRALAPKDFGLEKDSIPAASELPVQTLLSTGERAVSGYTVELFYP